MIEEKEEIWKTIEGYPNYKVSNMGNVKSLNYRNTGKEEILKPNKSRGYLKVRLCKDGKIKPMQLHRLVALAFVQNDSIFNTDVNHKNECKTDNRACNLEWCDATYNNNYGNRKEKVSKANTNHPKISKPVKCIETDIVYPSTREIQRHFGFAHQNITKCCNGKLKSAYKLHWEYA